MDAKLLPLEGKYYGTQVAYGTEGHQIEIWDRGDGQPSYRQLEQWSMTLKEAKESDLMCDSHYETRLSEEIACVIVFALRKAKTLKGEVNE